MIFNFIDKNGRLAMTDIEQYGNLIIMTELKENPGMSVTNAVEFIAEQFAHQNGLTVKDLIFVERYDERSYDGGIKPLGGLEGDPGERFPSYDLVSFSDVTDGGLLSPKWKYLSKDNFKALVSEWSV